MSERPEGGSSTKKIWIGCGIAAVLGVIGIVAGGAYFFSNAMTEDPAKVEAIVTDVTNGTPLPDGYSGRFGFDMWMVKFAALTKGDGATIMFTYSPADQSEQVQRDMAEAIGERVDATWVSETVSLDVGGEQTEFTKYKGELEDTGTWLRYEGLLSVQGTSVTRVLFLAPEASFDIDAMKSYLKRSRSRSWRRLRTARSMWWATRVTVRPIATPAERRPPRTSQSWITPRTKSCTSQGSSCWPWHSAPRCSRRRRTKAKCRNPR